MQPSLGRADECSNGGPGERCNYEWAAEGSRKQDAGQVHDVGLHGASARLGVCAGP